MRTRITYLFLNALKFSFFDSLESKIVSNCFSMEHFFVQGRSPIFIGAAAGHVNVLKCLAEIGARIGDLPDRMGLTPLHAAAYYGQSPCIELLINKLRENVHSVDHFGKTPLHLATEMGNTNECETLLKLKKKLENVSADRLIFWVVHM